jgi:hypothetical protein
LFHPGSTVGVTFSHLSAKSDRLVRDLFGIFAIRLMSRIIGIGGERLSHLLQCVLQCVADREAFRVGCRLARIQVIFFVSFRRHARGERFLLVAAIPMCVLKANGAILFFPRRHPYARRLLICSTAGKRDRTCRYHKNGRALQESPEPCKRFKMELSVHVCPHYQYISRSKPKVVKTDRRDGLVKKGPTC